MPLLPERTRLHSRRTPGEVVTINGGRTVRTSTETPSTISDEKAIEAAVLQHLRTLNTGDLDTGEYLSGATDFGLDSGPRVTAGQARFDLPGDFERRANLRLRDLRISVHKDAAVATGYLVGTVSLPGGGSKLVMGRSTFVHVRQNGTWKLAHTHLSPFVTETSGSLH